MHQEISMQYIVTRKKYILKYDLDYYDVIFLIKYFTGFISSTFTQIITIKLDLIENNPNIKPTRKKIQMKAKNTSLTLDHVILNFMVSMTTDY